MKAIEQLVDEIIRQRPYRAKAWKRQRRSYIRTRASALRYLTDVEVRELQQHVADCITSRSIA